MAESKKGDNVDMSSRDAKAQSKSRGPIKYSSLKDFSFCVSDIWDDLNICIFLECCHAHIDDLKNHNGSEENKVWEKIAKSGLEKSGSISCFNVNYCLELAKCLKSFVSKHEVSMMGNEIFKRLYEDVVDLLPYFAPVTPSRPICRTRSHENDKNDSTEGQTPSRNDFLAFPFATPSQRTQVVRMIAKIFKKYNIDELMKTTSRNAIWKEVALLVERDFGVQVNPRVFLEGYKKSVVGYVRHHADPQERAKIFLEEVDDLLPYFDLINPKSVKKSDFISVELKPTNEITNAKSDMRKRKNADSTVEEDACETATKPSKKLSSSKDIVEDNPDHMIVDESDPASIKSVPKNKSEQEVAVAIPNMNIGENADHHSNQISRFDKWVDESSKVMNESSVQSSQGRRGRWKNARKAPTKLDTITRKVLPTRQASRYNKLDTSATANNHDKNAAESDESQKKLEQSVPNDSKELVPVINTLTTFPKKNEISCVNTTIQEVLPRKINDGKKNDSIPMFCMPRVDTSQNAQDSEVDSEIEDVPLIGTNIRVHHSTGKVERCKPRHGMDPFVLLDNSTVESYLRARDQKAFNKDVYTRAKQNRSHGKVEPSLHHQPPAVGGVVVRRRGRPPKRKNLAKPHKPPPKNVSSSIGKTSVETSREIELVRNNIIDHSSNSMIARDYISKDLTRQPMMNAVSFSSTSSIAAVPTGNIVYHNPDYNRPEFFDKFERFVQETRRHELWKVHQLLKMHKELLAVEYKKKGVLERILTVLNERRERV